MRRSRFSGETTHGCQGLKVFNVGSKSVFYVRKQLKKFGLIIIQVYVPLVAFVLKNLSDKYTSILNLLSVTKCVMNIRRSYIYDRKMYIPGIFYTSVSDD